MSIRHRRLSECSFANAMFGANEVRTRWLGSEATVGLFRGSGGAGRVHASDMRRLRCSANGS
jgi:hypothetical protein